MSPAQSRAFVDLLVKIYAAGKFTQPLHALRIGQSLTAEGPTGRLLYEGRGVFALRAKPPGSADGKDRDDDEQTQQSQQRVFVPTQLVRRRVRRLGMLAGGSGITPMLQILRALRDEATATASATATAATSTLAAGEQKAAQTRQEHASELPSASLLFANQTPDDVLLRSELDELHGKHGMRVWYTVDRLPAQSQLVRLQSRSLQFFLLYSFLRLM